jgi:hypothetical protein
MLLYSQRFLLSSGFFLLMHDLLKGINVFYLLAFNSCIIPQLNRMTIIGLVTDRFQTNGWNGEMKLKPLSFLTDSLLWLFCDFCFLSSLAPPKGWNPWRFTCESRIQLCNMRYTVSNVLW